jgi:hypothetical protein
MKRTYSGKQQPTKRFRPLVPIRVQPKFSGTRLAYQRPKGSTVVMTPSETKYFDCGINAATTTAGTTWADTEVPCDNYVNSSGVAAAYTDSALVPSAVGTGYGQVVANRYKLKKIRVRGSLRVATASDQADITAPTFVRIMLVMDNQPQGAQAQGEDVMQDIGATPENLFSFKRVSDNSGRFRILKDEFLTLNVSGAGTDGSNTNSVGYQGSTFSMQYVPRLPINCNIKSGNSTPTVAGLINCNIFMLVYAQRAGSPVALTITGSSRCYYCE